jgi:lysophospholipase L1-like esterase
MPGQPTNQKTALRCVGCAAAAFIGFAALQQARAEMPAAPHALPTTAVPAAAGAPLAIPALAAPNGAAPQDVKPEAVLPQPGPLVNASPSGERAGSGEIECRAPARLTRLEHPLRRTARRLASGQALVVVAIGSSSTAGAGASSPAASYPSRLAVELQKLLHGHDVTVLNRGVNGEETPNMMARFATGVIAEHPQLVLWQVGTNSVLRDHPLKPHGLELRQGIEQLKEAGADVVLIDPQYAPRVLAKAETPGMLDQIALTARDENIDLFRRFAIMQDWYQYQHHSFDAFITRDGLHMNDWGYACWAQLLAAAIADAASPPVASAAAPHAR